jgi:hypothetical protein
MEQEKTKKENKNVSKRQLNKTFSEVFSSSHELVQAIEVSKIKTAPALLTESLQLISDPI